MRWRGEPCPDPAEAHLRPDQRGGHLSRVRELRRREARDGGPMSGEARRAPDTLFASQLKVRKANPGCTLSPSSI
jgi:hypothetical protein